MKKMLNVVHFVIQKLFTFSNNSESKRFPSLVFGPNLVFGQRYANVSGDFAHNNSHVEMGEVSPLRRND